LPEGVFDYVRLNHSFEHLLDPQPTLDRVRGLLAPSGRLFIGVPNVDSLPARIFGRHWWNLGPPVHPFIYSPRTLTNLLRDHGFEILSVRTNSNFSGLLGSLQMRMNEHKGVFSDTGQLHRNPLAKILANWFAKIIDFFHAGDCLEVVARRQPAFQRYE
jgi:SAM-dependent methyltransferase